jgi:cytochrome c biogenesis protein CcdA
VLVALGATILLLSAFLPWHVFGFTDEPGDREVIALYPWGLTSGDSLAGHGCSSTAFWFGESDGSCEPTAQNTLPTDGQFGQSNETQLWLVVASVLIAVSWLAIVVLLALPTTYIGSRDQAVMLLLMLGAFTLGLAVYLFGVAAFSREVGAAFELTFSSTTGVWPTWGLLVASLGLASTIGGSVVLVVSKETEEPAALGIAPDPGSV